MSGIIDNLPEGLTEYERGWIAGAYEFACMKDGAFYVGSTGRTMDSAIRRFLAERGYELPAPPEVSP